MGKPASRPPPNPMMPDYVEPNAAVFYNRPSVLDTWSANTAATVIIVAICVGIAHLFGAI